MRIAFLTSELSLNNGWGRYSRRLVESIAGIADVVLVTTEEARATLPAEVSFPVRTVSGFSSTKGLKRLALHLRCPERSLVSDCDLIFCLMEPLIPLAAIIAGSRPLVIGGIGTYLTAPLARRSSLHRRIYESAYRIVCISRYTERRLKQHLPHLTNTSAVPLGVERLMLRVAPVAKPREEPLFVTVGAIKARKGHDISVDAFLSIAKDFPRARYRILGSTKDSSGYVDLIRRKISESPYGNQVEIAGMVSDDEVIRTLDRATMHVLPSINDGEAYEGFGLVHLEANARGTVTIGSMDCGNEDAISPGESGFLVQQKDPVAVADIMRDALSNPDRLRTMEQTAFKFAQSMSWERTGQLTFQEISEGGVTYPIHGGWDHLSSEAGERRAG